jgi:predicted LPLAT superfamily acyltransferase
MTGYRLCAVIPTHNHVDALGGVIGRLREAGLPVIVIDDGSGAAIGERIRALCATFDDVEYNRHSFNGGKGFAVMCGLARALERGFSHAVQVDADGQHDLNTLGALIEASKRVPEALVTGVPRFLEPIPLVRRIFRPVTGFWVAINSVSLHMPDAMCGFRVYPLAATVALVRKSVRGRRMDFDIEVLVKAHWAGIPLIAVPVTVQYPKDNFSNFDALRDNVLLTGMQTRLFFGMLWRLPQLLFRRRPDTPAARWSSMQERGAYWGMRTLAGIYRFAGRRFCLAAMAPVVLYFYLTGSTQRRASREYLDRLWQSGKLAQRPTWRTSLRHFMAFGASALDKLAAWTGDIPRTTLQGQSMALLDEVEAARRGVFVITAHLGNPEVVRALAALNHRVPVNVLMHTEHARIFNRLIREFSPDSPVRAFPVSKVGVDTAMVLSEAIARGEWVVIAGDRVPVSESGRVVEVPFLGESALLPQGPYILGALLKAPAYLLFCVRDDDGFRVHFSKFADAIELPRTDRNGAIRRYARRFCEAMEERVAETPLQWFNFYPFWKGGDPAPTEAPGVERTAF